MNMFFIYNLIAAKAHIIKHRNSLLRIIKRKLYALTAFFHKFFSCKLLHKASIMNNAIICSNL